MIDRRISSRQTTKNDFLDGNSYTNELQCPKVDCAAMESENHHPVSNKKVKVKQSRYRPRVAQRVPGS